MGLGKIIIFKYGVKSDIESVWNKAHCYRVLSQLNLCFISTFLFSSLSSGCTL